MADTQNTNEI